MNLTQADDKVIKLINFYSISGNVIEASDPNSLDYRLRFRSEYDTCQKSIATTAKKIRKIKHISQNPIPNQILNQPYTFDIKQHLSEDIIFSAIGSKAYSFKVDNVATTYIEEQTSLGVWDTLQTITNTTPTNEFTEYKGLITASDSDNEIRIRFSGLYPYNLRDIALYKYSFPNSSAIPQYQQYNLYTMPNDFYQLNKLIFKGSQSEGDGYNTTPKFYWEKRNVLAIDYYYKGEFSIEYSAYPTTIDDSTAETYEFEIDVEACEAIPYYVASMMMMHENPSAFNKLFSIYQGMLANLDDEVKNGITNISNTLFNGTLDKSRLF